MNEDGGVNGADVVSAAGGHRSVGGIAEDNGVDLVRSSSSFWPAAGAPPSVALAERSAPEPPEVKCACPA